MKRPDFTSQAESSSLARSSSKAMRQGLNAWKRDQGSYRLVDKARQYLMEDRDHEAIELKAMALYKAVYDKAAVRDSKTRPALAIAWKVRAARNILDLYDQPVYQWMTSLTD